MAALTDKLEISPNLPISEKIRLAQEEIDMIEVLLDVSVIIGGKRRSIFSDTIHWQEILRRYIRYLSWCGHEDNQ